MRIFTSTDFPGVWPVGTAAVIIAENEESAIEKFDAVLHKRGLSKKTDRYEFTVQEINLDHAEVYILNDGDY